MHQELYLPFLKVQIGWIILFAVVVFLGFPCEGVILPVQYAKLGTQPEKSRTLYIIRNYEPDYSKPQDEFMWNMPAARACRTQKTLKKNILHEETLNQLLRNKANTPVNKSVCGHNFQKCAFYDIQFATKECLYFEKRRRNPTDRTSRSV